MVSTDTEPTQSVSVSSNTYYKFSKFYDFIFGRVYQGRILATIRSLNIPAGSRVLELGVGTGISFDAYPTNVEVVGVDLSQAMLDIAQQRIDQNSWNHIRVQCMNAAELDLQDHSFDYVMAFHLVSVVPDVQKLMNEMYRVCKIGGQLVVINHFRSPNWWVAPFMDCISPLTKYAGWRTTLRREEVTQSIPFKVSRSYKLKPWSLFTILIGQTEAAESNNPQQRSWD
jgi:phosphatidylethanolamine/phosphatidyl-N-methylethanolamine N-methyltransferase